MTIPHPIHLAPPHEGIVPHTYMIWKKSQLCTNCGTLHEWSEVYAKTHLSPQMHRGKYVTNLRPLHSDPPQYNLPIELREAEMHKVPFCHACNNPHRALDGLPFPPTPDPTPAPSWISEAKTARPPKAAAKPKATLDDLFNLLNPGKEDS